MDRGIGRGNNGHNHFRDCFAPALCALCERQQRKKNGEFAAVAVINVGYNWKAKLVAVAIQRAQFNYQHCEPIKLFMRHAMLEQLTRELHIGAATRIRFFATYNLMMFVFGFPWSANEGTKKINRWKLHTGCGTFSFLIFEFKWLFVIGK